MDRFFKGFLPGRDGKGDEKKPALPYKNTNKYMTFEQCSIYSNVLGVLDDDVILYDADSEPHSSILVNIAKGQNLGCSITERKDGRGPHLLALNDAITTGGNDVMLACGIRVDIKLGCKKGLECVKFRGIQRAQIYNEEPYQTIPKYLYPIKDLNIDFSALGEGDGRNQALFNYILTLQKHSFTTEEIRETIRIINKYVLKEPLSENELNVIIRDEAFRKKVFFKGKTFLHNEFARHIKAEYHITKINGQLHTYDNGIYVPGYDTIEKAMIKDIDSLTSVKRNEVLKYLYIVCNDRDYSDNVHLIAFKNGVYNLNTDTLEPFSPEYIITNKIPWDYNPNAHSELIDSVLDKISDFDSSVRDLLEEVAGACLYRSNKIGGGKSIILFGDKENGKSTYIEMLDCVLDKSKNVSHIDLRELNDRFKTIQLYGKLANLGDDISGEYIANTAVFKKIATGQTITAEEKGKPVIEFEPYSTMIFSANEIPRMHDPTGAALRRLLIVPFNHKFLKTDPDYDPAIKYKLCSQEVMEYFVQLAIAGLKRVLTNKSYTIPAKVQQEKDNYELENNPILAFIEDCKNDMGEIEGIYNEPTEDVYLRYCVYCSRNNFQAMNKSTFVKRINKTLGTTIKPVRFGKNIKKVFILE